MLIPGKFYNIKDSDMIVQVFDEIQPEPLTALDKDSHPLEVLIHAVGNVVNEAGIPLYPCALCGHDVENGFCRGDILFFDASGVMSLENPRHKKILQIDLSSARDELVFMISGGVK
mgnify:CR=1 FL=1